MTIDNDTEVISYHAPLLSGVCRGNSYAEREREGEREREREREKEGGGVREREREGGGRGIMMAPLGVKMPTERSTNGWPFTYSIEHTTCAASIQ